MPMILAHRAGSAEFYWAIGAELLLVVFTALLLLAPARGTSGAAGWRFRLWGLGSALVASGIALVGKELEVWPGNPLFPSGHTAWAVTISVFLAGRDRRWLPALVALLALLAVALVLANYHVLLDIAGGLGLGLAVGYGGWAGLARGSAAHGASDPRHSR